MVQWLGLPCFSLLRAGLGPISGSGTKIPQATMWPPPKKEEAMHRKNTSTQGERRGGPVKTEAETGGMPRNTWSHQTLRDERNSSSLEPSEEQGPADTLIWGVKEYISAASPSVAICYSSHKKSHGLWGSNPGSHLLACAVGHPFHASVSSSGTWGRR